MSTPKPRMDEERDAFVSRFMSDEKMSDEYSDRKRRLAVAYSAWRRAKGTENVRRNERSEFLTSTVKTNLSGLVRYDELEGRRCLVAPVVMINEGVHNGSGGAIYYPASELRNSVESWNHKPVTLNHPSVDGIPVSACTKEALDGDKMGVLLNAEWVGSRKAIRAEAWLDVERMTKLRPGLEGRIRDADVVEVSTGLYTDDLIENAAFEDEEFERIAFNHRPDHLAVLPDSVGACSVKDGAGLPRLNEQSKEQEIKQGASQMDRAKMINDLISNEKYGWEKADEQFLTELTDANLAKLFVKEIEANEKPAEEPKVEAPKVEAPKVEAEAKPVENEAKVEAPKTPVTLEEFVKNAPAGDIKETLFYAVNKLKAEKADLVAKLNANERCLFTKDELEGKNLDELTKLNKMVEIKDADFSGQASNPKPTANVTVQPLPDPWEEAE